VRHQVRRERPAAEYTNALNAVIYFAETRLDSGFPRAVFGVADNSRFGLWIKFPSPPAKSIFLDIILDVEVLHGLLGLLVLCICRNNFELSKAVRIGILACYAKGFRSLEVLV